jgi:hypothetical protein
MDGKKEKETRNDKAATPVKQPIKENPNPRANENIADYDKKEVPKNTEGVGSEIIDGEDG